MNNGLRSRLSGHTICKDCSMEKRHVCSLTFQAAPVIAPNRDPSHLINLSSRSKSHSSGTTRFISCTTLQCMDKWFVGLIGNIVINKTYVLKPDKPDDLIPNVNKALPEDNNWHCKLSDTLLAILPSQLNSESLPNRQSDLHFLPLGHVPRAPAIAGPLAAAQHCAPALGKQEALQ
eukprot:scaffold51487_cov18-Tisochrysis_lutea.AAC.1